MSYTIRLEDERGSIVAVMPNGAANFNRAVVGLTPDDFPWLTTLDPYGDTMFNRLQAPHLLRELHRLRVQTHDQDAGQVIDQVIELAERLRDQGPNLYLHFHGD